MEHRRSPIVRRRPARAVLRWPEPAADPRQGWVGHSLRRRRCPKDRRRPSV